MVSRETRVHALVMGIVAVTYVVTLALLSRTSVESEGIIAVILGAVVYGGAHAFLLWRDDDGLVPVESRLRFVAVVVILGLLGLAGAFLDTSQAVYGIRIGSILLLMGVVAGVVYWILEARSGYETSQESSA